MFYLSPYTMKVFVRSSIDKKKCVNFCVKQQANKLY